VLCFLVAVALEDVVAVVEQDLSGAVDAAVAVDADAAAEDGFGNFHNLL
jgi:hypothetical protein